MNTTVLIVDDEASVRNAMRRCLLRDGYTITTAESIAQAQALLSERSFDLVLSDLALPDSDGLSLLRDVAARHPRSMRLLSTGSDDTLRAAPELDQLVYRVVAKPWDDLDLRLTVRRALEYQSLAARLAELELKLRVPRAIETAMELPQ